MANKKGNGLPAKAFLPTHKTRLQFVQATQAKLQMNVKTDDGEKVAEQGDYIVVLANGATTVLKKEFFEWLYEPVKNKVDDDSDDVV